MLTFAGCYQFRFILCLRRDETRSIFKVGKSGSFIIFFFFKYQYPHHYHYQCLISVLVKRTLEKCIRNVNQSQIITIVTFIKFI